MKRGIVHPAHGYRINRKSDIWYYTFWITQGYNEYRIYTDLNIQDLKF